MEVILALLGFHVAIVGIWIGWWAPKAARIRDMLRNAEPELYFTVGTYGGPGGYGLHINLQNQGNATAHDVAVYLPDIQRAACQLPELPPGATPFFQVQLPNSAPVRTQQMKGLMARLVYHDRYGREFTASLPLVQQERADGFYDIGAGGNQPAITRPSMRFRDLWRLRKIV